MAVITTGQITLTVLNDVDISTVEPTNPNVNQLWLDSSVVPNQLKRWDGSKWVIINDPKDIIDEVDAVKQRVTKTETDIVQTKNDIALRVTQEEFDGLGNVVSSQGTQIGLNTTAINLRATKEDLKSYEGNIYKQSSAPPHKSGRLWLKTSVTPNILYRSTGSAWVKASPTDASDIGAYSQENADLLIQRVQSAEQKVEADSITGVVSSAINDDGEPLFAKTSEVKQTVDTWTAKFSQVGGENLFKNSEDLSSWVLYQGATLVSGYPLQVEVPEWSTDEAWRIRTTSAGTSEIKAYITISSDLAKLRSRPFTFSVYAKNNRTDASVRIGTNRFGSEILAPSEMKRIIISGENDNGLYMQLQLSAQTANHYLDVTLYHPKFETGWIATDWNDYLYTGITRIDKDGGHFGREGETIETGIGFDGVRIKDGATEIASFTGSGAVIKNLEAESINGDVVNTLSTSTTLNVGKTAGQFATVEQALDSIGNAKYLGLGVVLTINIYDILNEYVDIAGFTGAGKVVVNLHGRINGRLYTTGNSCQVEIYGITEGNVIKGSPYPFQSSGDSMVHVDNIVADAMSSSYSVGFLITGGSKATLRGADIVNAQDGIYVQDGAIAQITYARGNVTRYGVYSQSGVSFIKGTVPTSGNTPITRSAGGFVVQDGTPSQANSRFSPPPATTTTETRTFNQTDIYTYSVKYGARSTHYGSAAAQNRWDTSMTQMKGRIVFGSSVYSFISGRNSGTTPTVKLRLRRQNSTHGSSSSVSPTPEWSGAPSFGGATRGNWTPWVTIPYTLFNSSGYTFSFYDGSTGNSYAIWDKAELQITRRITQ